MPQFIARFGSLTPLIRGLVVAIILIPSAVTGFLGGSLADRISRKYTIGLGSLIFAVGSAVPAASSSLGLLIFARCLAGAGEGLFLSAGSVYVSEISPAHMRGMAVLLTTIFLNGGIAFGFFTCYGTVHLKTSWSWQIPFITSAVTGLGVAVATHFLPYSPRYLLLRGRREEAERVMDLLVDPSHSNERADLLRVGQTPGVQSGPLDMFGKGVRGRTILVMFLNMANQLTGMQVLSSAASFAHGSHTDAPNALCSDFVLYFAPLLFIQAGLDATTASLIASGVTGLLLLVVNLIGTTYVDRVGRRFLLINGGLAMGGCLVLLGCLYASGAAYHAGKWAIVALIELYTISYAATWSLVMFVYSNEICPSRVRSTAVSASRGANQLTNFVVAMTGPAFLARSASGPYFLYGLMTLFSALVAWAFCQETVGKTLETIDDSFDGSPYAVEISWPPFLKPSTEARQRKKSRSESQTLPGEETRSNFRANLVELNVIGSGSAIEE